MHLHIFRGFLSFLMLVKDIRIMDPAQTAKDVLPQDFEFLQVCLSLMILYNPGQFDPQPSPRHR